MSDAEDNVPNTPLDQKVDQASKAKSPPFEKYERKGEKGQLVAEGHRVIPESDPAQLSSWTMREIERALNRSVFKKSGKTLDQFGTDVNEKNDMRLRTLSTRLEANLAQQYRNEVNTGARPAKITAFDLKSQSLRMVTANSSMGSYQFQKTIQLPYMRKNLALGYQKVALLKSISTGISSLEKSVVAKLEAIKINTAGAVPRKQSFFQKLWGDINFLNRRRIAGNISNAIMDGKDYLYKKHAIPAFRSIHESLTDPGDGGGVNALRRKATGRLNTVRHKALALSESADKTTTLGKITGTTSAVAARATEGMMRMMHRVKLTPEASRKIGGMVSPVTEFTTKFNPFSANGYGNVGLDGIPLGLRPQGESGRDYDHLLTSFNSWRQEYQDNTRQSLGYLRRIAEKTEACCDSKQTKPRSPHVPKAIKRPDTPLSTDRMNAVKAKIPEPIVVSRRSRRVSQPAPVDTRTDSPSLGKTSIGSALRRGRQLYAKLHPNTPSQSVNKTDHFGSPVKDSTTWSMSSSDGPVNRRFFSSIFTNLINQVRQVGEAIHSGNRDRSMFERLQEKWKALREREDKSKHRRNSFEEIDAENRKRKQSLKDRWTGFKDRAGHLVRGVGANLAQGNLFGAGTSLIGDLFGWGSDVASEAAGDYFSRKGGRMWRRGKRGLGRLGRGLKGKLLGGVATTVATDIAENAVEKAGKKSLMRSAGRMTGRLLKGGAGKGVGLLADGISAGIPMLASGAVGATKLAGRAGYQAVTKGTPLLYRGAKAAAGLTWEGTKAVAPLALQATVGTGKAAGKLGWAATKGMASAGGALGKGLGSLAWKGIKGIGIKGAAGIATGIAADYAHDWFDKNTTGTTKRVGKSAATAVQWASTGAMLGSFIPGLGTLAGGAIGGALGALYENTDLISRGLSKAGSFVYKGIAKTGQMVGKAGSSLWHGMFGRDAQIDGYGQVLKKGERGVLGNIKASIFGADAKYAKNGQLIIEGKEGFLGGVKKKLYKNLFGDEKYSVVDKAKSVVGNIWTSMKSLPNKTMEYLTGVKPGSDKDPLGTALKHGWQGFKDGAKSLGRKAISTTAKTAKFQLGLAKSATDLIIDANLGRSAQVDKNGHVLRKHIKSIPEMQFDYLFGSDTKYSKTGEITKDGTKGLFPTIGRGIKQSLFGQNAKYDKHGNLISKDKPGLLTTIKAAFFGNDAKYDNKGRLISSGKDSFIGTMLSKFAKNVFGIDFDDKNSLAGKLKDQFTSVGDSLSKGVNSIVEGLKTGASSVGSAVSSVANSAFDAASSAGSYIAGKAGMAFKGLDGMLNKIIDDYEGGAKVITDTGGLTKYGISAKGNPGVNIRNLTKEQAVEIYKRNYVAPLGLDRYSPQVAFVALDSAINQGPAAAKKLLAQESKDPLKMIQMRRNFYQSLASRNPGKYAKYLKGWNARMDKLTKDLGYVKTTAANDNGVANSTYNAATTAAKDMGNVVPLKTSTAAVVGNSAKSTKTPTVGSTVPKEMVGPDIVVTAKRNPNKISGPTKVTPATIVANSQNNITQLTPLKTQTSSPTPVQTTPNKATAIEREQRPSLASMQTNNVSKPTPEPASQSMSQGSKDIEALVKALMAQTGATQANTEALRNHGGQMVGMQKAAVDTATKPKDTASNVLASIIPMIGQVKQGQSPNAGIVMSMARTLVQTG